MEIIANTFIGVGAFFAAIYCFILSRRLKKFSNMEEGMGAAIAVLSGNVTEMSLAIDRANQSAKASCQRLESTTGRAELIARRLELLIASLHDIPAEGSEIEKQAQKERESGCAPSFFRSGFGQGQKFL